MANKKAIQTASITLAAMSCHRLRFSGVEETDGGVEKTDGSVRPAVCFEVA